VIKHKTISEEHFFQSLVSELNQQKETRTLSLMIHLFAEYWINEVITVLFKNPDFVFKNSFSNKINLLKACGVIKEKTDLLKNIWIINQIRNDYAHNLFVDEIEKTTVDNIRNMVMLEVRYNNIDFASQLDAHSLFKAKAISTIMELQNLYSKLKGLQRSNPIIPNAEQN